MVTLHTERLVLRPFTEKDFPFFVQLETEPFCLEYEADAPPTREQIEKKFRDLLALPQQEDRTKYVFLVEKDGVPLGKVVIWQIDQVIDEWEMGWIFHPDHVSMGYASEASRALIPFVFNQLSANRICANCNDANPGSERLMQRLGMTREGVFRETRKLRGKFYGSTIYSILRREFPDLAK